MAISTLKRPLLDVLGEEHELLLRALDLFARHAERLTTRGRDEPGLTRAFLHFFRDFGDRLHHQREETRLFEWLGRHGLRLDSGPLGVLREEHEIGRELRHALGLLADILERAPGDRDVHARFRDLAHRYVAWMTAHIEKEEQVLFPIADVIARQTGKQPSGSTESQACYRAWVDAVEARAARWPRIQVSLEGLGTPYGFARLCETALERD